MLEHVDHIVITASKQPPLAFLGVELLRKEFEDNLNNELYLILTAYRIKKEKSPRDSTDEYFVIKKQSQIDLIEDSSLVKYYVFNYKNLDHEELFNFCLCKEGKVVAVSGDFLEFIQELGMISAGNQYYFYNNKPWKLAK